MLILRRSGTDTVDIPCLGDVIIVNSWGRHEEILQAPFVVKIGNSYLYSKFGADLVNFFYFCHAS